MVDEAADREFMRQALLLAARGAGRTSPNPLVGAVVVSADGVVVGRGYHARAGEAHAEIRALEAAGARARGATLYCTLEPCSHTGRTGPCAVAIVEAGIRRVVAAVSDPNPLVSGRGFAYLRAHGLDVTTGVGHDAARAQNAPFFAAMTRGRPFVWAKIATSLDGRIAAAPGRATRLTSPPADRETERLRAAVDAIAIGSGTLLADDPRLTTRGVHRERPLMRVVFDRRLRTPAHARLFGTLERGPVLVVTSTEAVAGHPAAVAALQSSGAEVCPVDGGLADVLAELGRRGIRSLLLEGGATLHRAAFAAGVVDRVRVYVSPHWLGPGGVPWDVPALGPLGGPGWHVWPCGPDVVVEGDVHRAD